MSGDIIATPGDVRIAGLDFWSNDQVECLSMSYRNVDIPGGFP